jgi:hypothetical protein
VPALQFVQFVLAAVLNFPTGHSWHVLALNALMTVENVPALQFVHNDPFLYVATGQNSKHCAILEDPGEEMVFSGQLVHAPPPHVLLYVFAGQFAHVVVPTTLLYFPSPQQYMHLPLICVNPELQVPVQVTVPEPLPP